MTTLRWCWTARSTAKVIPSGVATSTYVLSLPHVCRRREKRRDRGRPATWPHPWPHPVRAHFLSLPISHMFISGASAVAGQGGNIVPSLPLGSNPAAVLPDARCACGRPAHGHPARFPPTRGQPARCCQQITLPTTNHQRGRRRRYAIVPRLRWYALSLSL